MADRKTKPPPPVHIRIMGSPAAVARVAAEIKRVLDVIEESQDYRNTVPNRVTDPGVRRYLVVESPRLVKRPKHRRRI